MEVSGGRFCVGWGEWTFFGGGWRYILRGWGRWTFFMGGWEWVEVYFG